MLKMKWIYGALAIVVLAFAGASCIGEDSQNTRETLRLDGVWQVEQGTMDKVPEQFSHTIVVPGLVTMAEPGFEEVGVVSEKRQGFWYRKTFVLDKAIPQTAILKISKAKFGTLVYLNGKNVGEHLPCFTPGLFDVRDFLKGNGEENELIVRVGANRESLPLHVPGGYDIEKSLYIPGIYDSVKLTLTGALQIVRAQAAPDLANQSVRVQTVVKNNSTRQQTTTISWTVTEKDSGEMKGLKKGEAVVIPAGETMTLDTVIPIKEVHLWSPDDPFLYNLKVNTHSDDMTVAFGMRSFRFHPDTGFGELNGKPYFLKGTNVCIFRFFEDPACKAYPWDEEWVRKLHRKFKSMHWDTIRYCIGFPPEMWYRIADEEGLLIQNEFPIWYSRPHSGSKKITAEELTREFTDWIHEHANHPCVIIWDASNESTLETDVMGEAIKQVRRLDLSNRPWENSRNPLGQKGDCFESHPYQFRNWHFRIRDLAEVPRFPYSPQNPRKHFDPPSVIVNEYGWLWLDRQGKPCTLTEFFYDNLLGPQVSNEQRREVYARYLATLTEFWRSSRKAAGVLHFCGLGYSRPKGATSDNFIDLDDLVFEPHFERYMRDAFSPIGITIEAWPEEIPSALSPEETAFDVVVINDNPGQWQGTVRFCLLKGEESLLEMDKEIMVSASETLRVCFKATYPSDIGSYAFIARLLDKEGKQITRSIRNFNVVDAAKFKAKQGVARGKTATASSAHRPHLGQTYGPDNLLDGSRATCWVSERSDEQWISIDLEDVYEVHAVEILWERSHAKTFVIEVSLDGESWSGVYATDSGRRETRMIEFAPTKGRWIRLSLKEPGWENAPYTIYELNVFGGCFSP